MTGLSEFVIRAWEKRYKAVVPARTETNRRLYSEEDIEKLRLLNEAVKIGHNIGGIAGLTITDLESIIEQNSTTKELLSEEVPSDINSLLDVCIEAVKAYDAKELETILLKASSKLSQPQLIENLIVPLVYKLGELWHEGLIRVANEHLATAVIRSFLASLIDQNEPDKNAPILISAAPRGQDHELGAMIVGVTAAPLGWKVIYLGPNLPVEEIAAVADSLEAKVVALSIVYPGDDQQLKLELQNLRRILPQNTSLIIGGRASVDYLDIIDEIGATHIKDTKRLRLELDSIRKNKYD
ncbi:MAG: MerR family transcriptional regulator [Ignavibacteria bacterium]|nr:MerR family transcriptional regulator [Ignavibacteria bacterium]MBT8384048.1 MerR family transcriptional regulator [Ignavibacteria bacterium]MBT8392243.1 MerR family transcriptional regulator [Ignavibacteria bacterium]NNL21806.1 MerR family transcriptional regulator [Ignavibacteriaceae bacterium]